MSSRPDIPRGADEAPPRSRSLARGFKVLEAVASVSRPIGVTEVALQVGLDKGTTSRLLAILRELGYLRQSAHDRQYELGARCLWLAHVYSASREELARRAAPVLEILRDSTQETVHLAVREGRNVVAIAQRQPDQELLVHTTIGAPLLLQATASGRAILGAMPLTERESFLAQAAGDAAVPNGKNLIAEALADINRASEDGWIAVDLHDDILRVSSAVVNPYGEPIAAVTVSGPKTRMSDRVKVIGQEVLSAAARIAGAGESS